MCTLAAYVQCSAAYPLVIAANRDELYARPATSPKLLGQHPWIVGGQDVVAGGTWFGVNSARVAAGILNRRTVASPDPTRRSRGQLCLDVLGHSAAADAATAVQRQPGTAYNAFNLLIADPAQTLLLGNASGEIRCTSLPPGVHVLTNLDLNDMECPRLAKSYALFGAATTTIEMGDLPALLERLRDILSDHSTPLDPRDPLPTNNVCMHGEKFGTRSSSILVYEADQGRFRFWHADGPPCLTPYEEIALPMAGTVDNPASTG